MRLKIEHSIRYEYEDSVLLEPHLLRMTPRSDVRQRVVEHAHRIAPEPLGLSPGIDIEGNQYTLAWFEGTHRELEISSETIVETVGTNPFDYVITAPACAVVPARYPQVYEGISGPYRERLSPGDEITEFAWGVAEAAGLDSSAFLLRLAQTIANEFDYVERETGPARTPAEVLGTRYGACRDLAALYVDACRALRLLARFVSGYVYSPDAERAHLHAWCEVYLPGPGWRGYDPSAGLAETDAYVSCARGAALEDAGPVRGSFRSGMPGDSTMTTHVNITLAE